MTFAKITPSSVIPASYFVPPMNIVCRLASLVTVTVERRSV